MRIRELFNESLLTDYTASRIGKEDIKLWVTPNHIDTIMRYGQHDQLCYNAASLQRPGDPSDADAIPWQDRAIAAGWIRVSINARGTEINVEFMQGKIKASLPAMEHVLDYLPDLQIAYAEVHQLKNARFDYSDPYVEPKQQKWPGSQLMFCLKTLSRSR